MSWSCVKGMRHQSLIGAKTSIVMLTLAFLTLFAPLGRSADALSYYKNYFVTGDYTVAGVGLRGTGVQGWATGTITIAGVPCTSGVGATGFEPCGTTGAVASDIVAAYLYWQTEEETPAPSAANGYFDGHAIVGAVLGNPNNSACWSSGGTTGPSERVGTRLSRRRPAIPEDRSDQQRSPGQWRAHRQAHRQRRQRGRQRSLHERRQPGSGLQDGGAGKSGHRSAESGSGLRRRLHHGQGKPGVHADGGRVLSSLGFRRDDGPACLQRPIEIRRRT